MFAVSPDLSECYQLLFHLCLIPILGISLSLCYRQMSRPDAAWANLRRAQVWCTCNKMNDYWSLSLPSHPSFFPFYCRFLFCPFCFWALLSCAVLMLSASIFLCFSVFTWLLLSVRVYWEDKCSENASIFTSVPLFPVCFTVLPPGLPLRCFAKGFSCLWAGVVLQAQARYK